MTDVLKTYRDYVEEKTKALNDKVDRTLENVKSIDRQILNLINQRNHVLYGLNSETHSFESFKTCLGYSPKSVWDGYCKEGFKSDCARNATMNLRRLFFDDSDKRYQDFSCIHIKCDTYDGTDIQFIFENSNKDRMQFTFNILERKTSHLYDNKLLAGYIYFGVNEDNQPFGFNTVERTFDTYKIRDAIREYIENGCKATHYYQFDRDTLIGSANSIFKEFEEISFNKMRNNKNNAGENTYEYDY